MNLVTTHSLSSHIGQDVMLQCRLIGLQRRTSQFGKPYLQLKVSDSQGSAKALVWSGDPLFHHIERLDSSHLAAIELIGRVVRLDQHIFLKAQDLSLVSASHVVNGALLLPKMMVPVLAHDAHEWLVNFIERMPSETLRAFLTGMLLDPAIGFRFIRCRASENNHHRYPGGLLVHCVQMARIIEGIGHELELTQSEILISQVGAILHDLGKIQTVGDKNPRPMPPKLFRHEVLSLVLVAPHLKKLSDVAPVEGWLLTHILDRLISSKSSLDSRFIGEDLIRFADYLSAANQAGKSLDNFMSIGSYHSSHPSQKSMHQDMRA